VSELKALVQDMAPGGRLVTPGRLLRWASLVPLLIGGLVFVSSTPRGELLWLPVRFFGSPLSVPLPSRFQFAAVFISSVAAAIAFGWTTYREEARRALADSADSGTWMVWLSLCLLALLGLLRLMQSQTDAGPNASDTLAIVTLSLVALISWCLAAMPARFWWSCVSGHRLTTLGATAVGLSVFAIGHHYATAGILKPIEYATLNLSSAVLHLVTTSVTVDYKENLLGANGFSVHVGEPCAGVEGIALFSIFFGVYLWICRAELHFPRTLILVPIGFIALFCLNVLRLVALILLGAWSGSLAIEGFHSVAGWLLFNAVALSMVVATKQSGFFSKAVAQSRHTSVRNPAAPYLMPLVTILVATMVTRIFSFSFDALYPLRAAALALVLWHYRARVPLRWTLSWSAVFLGCVAFGVWILLAGAAGAPARDAAIATGLNGLSRFASLWVMARICGAVILVPIAEELAFRGYLLRKLISADFEKVALRQFTWLSFLGSSILFGAVHAEWLAGILAGMIFAIAMYRRGSLTDAVVAHATTNGLLAAYVLMTGHWSLWD
jgi:exosortase E/protease (VPEID-CTERM system)